LETIEPREENPGTT